MREERVTHSNKISEKRTRTMVAKLGPKKSIDDLGSLKGKKVLVRVDFNVPVQDGRITNDLRIRETVPTIQKILSEGGRAILMSHLGRPSGVMYAGIPLNPSSSEYVLVTWSWMCDLGKSFFVSD